MRTTLVFLFAAVCLAGCATPGSTWISSTRFDYLDYENSKVTLLPVVVNPLVTDPRLDTEAIEQSVARQLRTLELYNVQTAHGIEVEFPYTPRRLVALGAALQAEVAVGVSITRMDVRPLSRQWFITGNIIFIDVKVPERYWTLAKTWRFSGEPSDEALMQQQLQDTLTADFRYVRAALRRSRTSTILRRDTVAVDPGPILSLDAADWSLTSNAKTAQGKVTIADPDSYEQNEPRLQVDYAAIDDNGIAELVVENTAASFRASIISHQGGERKSSCKSFRPWVSVWEVSRKLALAEAPPPKSPQAPIFLADRLLVPLARGLNNITLTATNNNCQTVTRNLKFVNKDSDADGTRELMMISAAELAQLPGTAILTQAKQEIAELESKQGVTLGSGGRALTFAGQNATRERILLSAAAQWAQPRSDTRRELALLGRAEIVEDKPFIYLYNSNAKFPTVGALSLEELRRLLGMGVSKATLELCTRESPSEQLLKAYQTSLGSKATISVTPDCEQPLGMRMLEIARKLHESVPEPEDTQSADAGEDEDGSG